MKKGFAAVVVAVVAVVAVVFVVVASEEKEGVLACRTC